MKFNLIVKQNNKVKKMGTDLDIFNVEDVVVQQITRKDNVIWRMILVKDDLGHRTRITLFSNDSKNLIFINQ